MKEDLQGKEFTVALHLAEPFVFYDKTKSGNERFSGITVEVLDMVCERGNCKLGKYKKANNYQRVNDLNDMICRL